MGWAFSSDSNGVKIINTDGTVIRSNQQVTISPGSDGTSITIIMGSNTRGFQVSDIDTIAESSPAGSIGAIIEQLIPVFPDALAQAVAGAVKSINGEVPDGSGSVTLTASDIGLGNINNTSDANKPVSTAQQAALNLKANIASPVFTGNVGIGVPAPAGKLHVGDGATGLTSAAANAGIVSTSNQAYGVRMYLENLQGATGSRVFMLGNYGNVFSVNVMADNATSFIHANAVLVDGDGNVSLSKLVGTGVRIVTVSASGQLSATASIITGSSPTLTFPDVPAGGTLDLGFDLVGAAIGDTVALGIPSAAQNIGVFFAMVSNTDVITIRFYNNTASTVTVPGGEYKATVFKI